MSYTPIKHKVLVIEDNTSLLKMFKYFLINEYLEVFTAKDGFEALEILKTTSDISVIVSDYKLPKMNGIECLKKAKQITPLATRIIMSAYKDETLLVDAINIGEVYRFLNKPIDFNSFRLCIDSAIVRYEEEIKKNNEFKLKENRLKKLLTCLNVSNIEKKSENDLISNNFLIENLESFSINLFDMAISLSSALDLIFPSLYNHHKQVCYIATTIAEEIDLPSTEYQSIFLASILHDIGAVSLDESLDLNDFDTKNCQLHGSYGAKFFEIFSPLKNSSELVKHHHINWENGKGKTFKGNPVSIGSHIIHLADRISVLENKKTPIFEQIPNILDKIKKNIGNKFNPEICNAFMKISKKESFWLDLNSPFLKNVLLKKFNNQTVNLKLEGLLEFSKFFSSIIDSRSRFTSNHSCGVATSGENLAKKLKLSKNNCLKIKVAGYLHDLGKLVVPKNILEKPGKLSQNEWNIVKTHTYYTYSIINSIRGMKDIAEIASFHHETLDGSGYPFHHNYDYLSMGARIIAVSDVFTALAEDRPYRTGMPKREIEEILKEMVKTNKLDGKVVNTLLTHYDEIDLIRRSAQEEHINSIKN